MSIIERWEEDNLPEIIVKNDEDEDKIKDKPHENLSAEERRLKELGD